MSEDTAATEPAHGEPRTEQRPARADRRWLSPRALWRRYVLDVLHDEERASREATDGDSRPFDWKIVGLFVVVAVCLILLEYLGKNHYYWQEVRPRPVGTSALDMLRARFGPQGSAAPPGWYSFVAFRGPPEQMSGAGSQLPQLLYWAGWCVTAYFVIPALYVRLVLRKTLREFGLTLRGVGRHMWLYVAMFAVVLPFVFLVSSEPSFLIQYPFYRYSSEDPRGFWIWEIAYAAQFFSLEFFFRGFMIHGLKDRLGPYAVLIMMVPYVMIHFGKPMPETFGAIIAGVVLGVLALRTGSIFLGFLIHVSVALAMDLVSLWRQGHLGAVFEGLF